MKNNQIVGLMIPVSIIFHGILGICVKDFLNYWVAINEFLIAMFIFLILYFFAKKIKDNLYIFLFCCFAFFTTGGSFIIIPCLFGMKL